MTYYLLQGFFNQWKNLKTNPVSNEEMIYLQVVETSIIGYFSREHVAQLNVVLNFSISNVFGGMYYCLSTPFRFSSGFFSLLHCMFTCCSYCYLYLIQIFYSTMDVGCACVFVFVLKK